MAALTLPGAMMISAIPDSPAGGLLQLGRGAMPGCPRTPALHLHRSHVPRGGDFDPAAAHFCRCRARLTTSMIKRDRMTIRRKHHAECGLEHHAASLKCCSLLSTHA